MISYYRKLVAESPRLQAFRRAIETTMHSACKVCEIGTGLGTYAFMASRAGAAKVYAIEESRVLELARKLYAVNRKDLGEIIFIKGHSTAVHLPEKVDAIIYENYDCLGLTPEHEKVLLDARRRFLRPRGTFIPEGINLYWVPLEASSIWREEVSCLEAQGEKVLGLDYALTRDLATQERVVTSHEAEALLGDPTLLVALNFANEQSLSFVRELSVGIKKAGTLHGFGSWVDFLFPSGHVFSLSYEKPVTSYGRAFFPLPKPISVEEGDVIQMKVSVLRKPLLNHTWSWWGKITDQQGNQKGKWHCSSLQTAPFQSQDLQLPKVVDGSYRPTLNAEGRLRKFVLESMNGTKTVEEIARQVHERFPDEVHSFGDAMNRVARLFKKYSS